MDPVVAIYLVGFGSAGAGWLLSRAGEAANRPESKNGFLKAIGIILIVLGIGISTVGTMAALDAASDPGKYGVKFD
jgi:hypothetical protein